MSSVPNVSKSHNTTVKKMIQNGYSLLLEEHMHGGYVLSNSIVHINHMHQEQGFLKFSFLHGTPLVPIWRAMLQHKAVSNVHIWDLLYLLYDSRSTSVNGSLKGCSHMEKHHDERARELQN